MGLKDLTNEDECSNAVIYAISFNVNAKYMSEGSWSEYPKGCYIWDHDGDIYFNVHHTGKKNTGAKSICKGIRYFSLHTLMTLI